MSNTTKQANFLPPELLLDELKRTVDKRRQSKVVSEALRKEFKRMKLAKAFESSFGAWKDKDHPEMREGTAAYVRKIRKSTRGKQGCYMIHRNTDHCWFRTYGVFLGAICP